MRKIHVLPDILASQVAAGEVVERPASVVRELLDNSIDANAKEILLEIERGGISLIRITDDGDGMGNEDALLATERHATSKLKVQRDLAEIRTLGFRGEALPSIASVAKMKLITREHDAISGTEVVIEGGKLIHVREAGIAPGTCIEVRQLFFNVPARRKFLKTENTEAAHIEHELRMHALAHPQIRFRLRKDGDEVIDFPAVKSRADRLRHLLGIETSAELLEIPTYHGNAFSLEGYVLPAAHARKGRRHQCFFLNGRHIEDAAISRGLIEGFRGGLMDGLHPAAWLWLEMEPQMVDVNVHPAKREVRFHRAHELRDGIADAVSQIFQKPKPQAPEKSPLLEIGKTVSFIKPSNPFPTPTFQAELPVIAQVESAKPKHDVHGANAFRIIDAIGDRFIVMESADGLVLLDPRAARERIIYEALLAAKDKNIETQGLLVPILLELEPREFEIVHTQKNHFDAAGLELEEFGGGTVQLRSFPALLKVKDEKIFLREVIDELLSGGSSGSKMTYEKIARAIARRAALGEKPQPEQTNYLLEELFRCDLPYCAADGRPVLTEFSLRELERRFQSGGR